MKKYRDERYEKYLNIIFDWNEKLPDPVSCGVVVYDIRKELYNNNTYYVFGIGVSNFLEEKGYDMSQDWLYEDKQFTEKRQREIRDIVKRTCASNKLSLGSLMDLYNQLKEAGAKEVYLHPATYWYKTHTQFINDQQLIVIQDEDDVEQTNEK